MLEAPGPPTPRNWRQTQASAVIVAVTGVRGLIAGKAFVLAGRHAIQPFQHAAADAGLVGNAQAHLVEPT